MANVIIPQNAIIKITFIVLGFIGLSIYYFMTSGFDLSFSTKNQQAVIAIIICLSTGWHIMHTNLKIKYFKRKWQNLAS